MYKLEESLAIIPFYKEGYGNASKIIGIKNELIVEKRLSSLIKDLCRQFFIDPIAMREEYRELLGIRNTPPLYIDGKVFLPLKTREPILKNDGSIGYICLDSIYDIRQENGQNYLILSNRKKIRVYNSYSTINRHMINARLVQVYEKRKKGYSLEDFIATKKDIKILEKKIDYLVSIMAG